MDSKSVGREAIVYGHQHGAERGEGAERLELRARFQDPDGSLLA
ncbi:MAG: hypothetical protein ABIT01_20680 [Thermoanaerobaculia bacterium]